MQDREKLFDTVAAAETKQATYETITEGKYLGFCDGAKINEARDPAQVSLTWKIVSEGPSKFANRLVFANYQLNEKGIPFLKSDLRKLGKTTTLATLRSDLESLIGVEAEIYVKPKVVGDKTYYSVYVNDIATKDYSGFNHTESIPF